MVFGVGNKVIYIVMRELTGDLHRTLARLESLCIADPKLTVWYNDGYVPIIRVVDDLRARIASLEDTGQSERDPQEFADAVTIIMPFRGDSRNGKSLLRRLEFCLRAFNLQSGLVVAKELVVVSSASSAEVNAELAEIVTRYQKVRVVYDDEQFRWSQAKIINRGILESESPYVMSIDCDIVLPHKYLWRLCQSLAEDACLYGIVIRLKNHEAVRDTPNVHELTWEGFRTLFPKMTSRQPVSDHCGTGPITVPRKVIESIGGWDDSFIDYGYEDYDVLQRIRRSGCEVLGKMGLFCFHLDHSANPIRGKHTGKNREMYLHGKAAFRKTELYHRLVEAGRIEDVSGSSDS